LVNRGLWISQSAEISSSLSGLASYHFETQPVRAGGVIPYREGILRSPAEPRDLAAENGPYRNRETPRFGVSTVLLPTPLTTALLAVGKNGGIVSIDATTFDATTFKMLPCVYRLFRYDLRPEPCRRGICHYCG
jgi:hypothetical protein